MKRTLLVMAVLIMILTIAGCKPNQVDDGPDSKAPNDALITDSEIAGLQDASDELSNDNLDSLESDIDSIDW
ncbi:MAG: hypothetical protein AABW49_01515 [Nanoarchaeota archaeon]